MALLAAVAGLLQSTRGRQVQIAPFVTVLSGASGAAIGQKLPISINTVVLPDSFDYFSSALILLSEFQLLYFGLAMLIQMDKPRAEISH